MRILLIHQNFPGQFRSLSTHLSRRGHDLTAICSHQRPIDVDFRVVRYDPPNNPPSGSSLGQEIWHGALYRADQIARLCSILNSENWTPDCILGHSGWGETISLHLIWPSVPVVLWPELWVKPLHGGYGLDPDLPRPNLDNYLEQLGRNSLTRVALDYASAWVMPTNHQALSLPSMFRDSRLHVIHEGIDTELNTPNPNISFNLGDLTIDRSVPTLTFVNRNLERLRGFDQFMKSLPMIQSAFPELRVIIVGDSKKGYGSLHPSGKPLRDVMVDELSQELDMSHIHFLGRIPYDQYLALLQTSWVHVYLSYPFVLGWSLLEAMACSCAIVGSNNLPVSEVITNGFDGLLVPMNDHLLLAKRVLTLLNNPELRIRLGHSARETAMNYDQSKTLPRLTQLIENFS